MYSADAITKLLKDNDILKESNSEYRIRIFTNKGKEWGTGKRDRKGGEKKENK